MRTKPTNAHRASLHTATQADMEALLRGTLEMILTNRKGLEACIMVKTDYTFSWPKGFPKGMLRKKEGLYNYWVFQCKRVLEWLHTNGYTDITPKNIQGYRIKAAKLITEIERKLDGEREE